jgi:cytochrome c5
MSIIIKRTTMNKKSAARLALSFSALLAISACSGDNTTDDATPVDEVETTVVEVAEPEAIEPVEETAITEAPAMPTDEVAVVEADTDNSAEPELLAANAGEELYKKQCMACHQNGLLGAPLLGDKAAWAPRIAKGKETLYMHSAQGFNKMNAQASAEVSVAQVHAAVDYMIAAAS